MNHNPQPSDALIQAFKGFDQLQSLITEEKALLQQKYELPLLSIIHDVEDNAKQLSNALDQASQESEGCTKHIKDKMDHVVQILDENKCVSRDQISSVLLSASHQAELLRILQMNILLPENLQDPGIADVIQKFKDISANSRNDWQAADYATVQTSCLTTLARVFQYLLSDNDCDV
ncbi:hypothetical protein FB446DRAFT_789174 [Lentinula raphanica]|nr:hypothetical protein FB446DRAFT_789174 [Lentinula raphanica]